MEHIEKITESFLSNHPGGLIAVTGDFNTTSTGLKEHVVKHKTSLTQIIRVLTRDTGVLDWLLTKKRKFFQPPLELPKIGRSDHYAVLVKHVSVMNSKVAKKTILRGIAIIAFGRWITSF